MYARDIDSDVMYERQSVGEGRTTFSSKSIKLQSVYRHYHYGRYLRILIYLSMVRFGTADVCSDSLHMSWKPTVSISLYLLYL